MYSELQLAVELQFLMVQMFSYTLEEKSISRRKFLVFSKPKKIKLAKINVLEKNSISTSFGTERISMSKMKFQGKFTPLGYNQYKDIQTNLFVDFV